MAARMAARNIKYIVVGSGYTSRLLHTLGFIREQPNLVCIEDPCWGDAQTKWWTAPGTTPEEAEQLKAFIESKRLGGVAVFRVEPPAKNKQQLKQLMKQYVEDLGQYDYCAYMHTDFIYGIEFEGE